MEYLKSGKKLFLIILLSVILMGMIYIAVLFIRIKRPYYFDMAFNMTKEHVSYETGTKYSLPLPRRVTWGYRTSDNSCVYRTEMTFDEIISTGCSIIAKLDSAKLQFA